MRYAVAVLTVLLLPCWVAATDVVELRSGRRIEGVFKGADDASVRIQVGSELMTTPNEVRAIYYGEEGPASTASQAIAEEALVVLKDLQKATLARPSLSEYRGRLAYARFRLDVLSSKLTDRDLVLSIAGAVHFFEIAAEAWVAMMRPPVRDRAEDVRAVLRKDQETCTPLRRLASANADALVDGVVAAAWSCGSDKIAELEKRLAAQK